MGYGGQLETAVDLLCLATHGIDHRTDLDGRGLMIYLCPEPEEPLL